VGNLKEDDTLYSSLRRAIRFPVREESSSGSFLLGVLPGEGIGPEVIQAALQVLTTVVQVTGARVEVVAGGPIGIESESLYGTPLCDPVIDFCSDVFQRGGAILAGPGGGRFVYNLRKQFDLFCKIIPVSPFPSLKDSGVLRRRSTKNIDFLVVRENISGIYQGKSVEGKNQNGERFAEHSLHYRESEVIRVLEVAAQLAADRKGSMMAVVKDAGLPAFSRLWRECAADVSSRFGIQCSFVNVDLAAYLLVQQAQKIDVVVSSNLFGDILGDLSAVLMGSRGISYGANFSGNGAAVYQTNHGAAFDLQGLDQANPAGQILALAMLLRESFGLIKESNLIRKALIDVWQKGWRTADLQTRGECLMGTSLMAKLVCDSMASLSSSIRISKDQ
jgi:3-isopropylmalate dehydrogenase